MKKVEIGIDCEPFAPRPEEYLPGVLEGTGLDPNKQTVLRFFGAWTWEYEVEEELWKKIRPVIYQRLVDLYEKGCIRGATVTKE